MMSHERLEPEGVEGEEEPSIAAMKFDYLLFKIMTILIAACAGAACSDNGSFHGKSSEVYKTYLETIFTPGLTDAEFLRLAELEQLLCEDRPDQSKISCRIDGRESSGRAVVATILVDATIAAGKITSIQVQLLYTGP